MKGRWFQRMPGLEEGWKYMTVTQIITDGAGCYPWTEHFAILPRTTVTGQRVWWQKIYRRRVWLVWGTGYHMEPATQWATIFDLLVYDADEDISTGT